MKIFIFIAAALILMPNLRFLYVKMRYVKVLAVCASVNSRRDYKGHENYQPIWQYNYDGTTYYSHDKSWSTSRYTLGEKTEIYIFPRKPMKIYTGSVASVVAYTVIVLIMILIMLLVNFLFNSL